MASDHSTADSFICSLGSTQDTAKYMEMDMVCKEEYSQSKYVREGYLGLIIDITDLLNNKSEIIIPWKSSVCKMKI